MFNMPLLSASQHGCINIENDRIRSRTTNYKYTFKIFHIQLINIGIRRCFTAKMIISTTSIGILTRRDRIATC